MAWFSVSFLANNGGLMRFNIPSLFRGLCSQLRPYVMFGLLLGLHLPAIALVGAEPNEAMWQGNAMRGGLVTDSLALPLAMRWEKQLETPSPAWPEGSPKVAFDKFTPFVCDSNRLYVPSVLRGAVDAWDLETGRRVWTAFAQGPVRFAPLVVNGRVLFVSDDGALYCVSAADG